MTLATRCIHCQTVFRLSAAHLSAAQGWVRCGACSQVFDASAHLVKPDGTPLEVPTIDDRGPPSYDGTRAAPSDLEPPPALQPLPDIDLELPDLGELAPADPAVASPPVASSPPTAADTREPYWSSPEPQPEPAAVEAAVVAAPQPQPQPEPATARPSSTWEPARRSGASAWLIGLLVLTLLAQFAYMTRGHIAQGWPELRAPLAAACQTIGCTMPAVRQLQAVSLGSQSISFEEETSHHRVRLSIANSLELPVVMPALELTLLGAEGEVLARRAIDPVEFDQPASEIPAGGSLDISLTLDLKALGAGIVSSFRIEPYYP